MEKVPVSKAAWRRMKEGKRKARKRKQYVRELRAYKPTGRNDLCRCGSGKKFKKCCMKAQPVGVEQGEVMTHKQLADDIQKRIASVFQEQEGDNVA